MRSLNWAGWIVLLAGLAYAAAALLMLGAPVWFYENVGHFPSYNRHYIGDVAAFTLALAVGLVWAARDVVRYRILIGMGMAASLIHVANHMVDAIGSELAHWVLDVGLVAVWLSGRVAEREA